MSRIYQPDKHNWLSDEEVEFFQTSEQRTRYLREIMICTDTVEKNMRDYELDLETKER